MKLPIFLVGEDSLALASLKQQLEREGSVAVEPRVYGYAEAFDVLKSRTGALIAVIDINQDPERAFSVAEQIKLRLPTVRLVMTSPTGMPVISNLPSSPVTAWVGYLSTNTSALIHEWI